MHSTLQKRLTEAMKPHGGRGLISRAELADACRISRAAVTKWFNGDPPVTKLAGPNLIAVSKLCGVRPEWLANGTPPMRVGSDGAVPSSMWGYEGVTPEAAELGRDWAQLEEPTRSVIRDLIVMAVAAQKRRGKTKRLTEHRPTQPALSVHEP